MQTTPLAANHPAALRHPFDPEPVPSTKARTVFVLGLVSVLTGPFIGGVVPATLALVLSRQAWREAYVSEGYLTGAGRLRRGEWLAWGGIVLALTVVVTAIVIGVLRLVDAPAGRDFAPSVD